LLSENPKLCHVAKECKREIVTVYFPRRPGVKECRDRPPRNIQRVSKTPQTTPTSSTGMIKTDAVSLALACKWLSD
jgi:hypothetical protein